MGEENVQSGGDNEVLNIRVKDQQGGEISFKVKKSSPFSKIFDAYAARYGLEPSLIRFFYDGVRLSKENTPKMFEMEDNDEIIVVVESIGGRQFVV